LRAALHAGDIEMVRPDGINYFVLISMHDVRFCGGRIAPEDMELLRRTRREKDPTVDGEGFPLLRKLYDDSFEWIFNGKMWPGFERFCLPPPQNRPQAIGASLVISQEFGTGIYTVWEKWDQDENPLNVKKDALEQAQDIEDNMGFRLNIEPGKRYYPFLALHVGRANVTDYCMEHALELGRLFTGGDEWEEDQKLQYYMTTNCSHRSYERLFLRWTDALAVYSDFGAPEAGESIYPTLCRAVLLFELCIVLEWRLKDLMQRADSMSTSWQVYNPWAVNRLLDSFASAERDFIVAPPIASVEAGVLMRQAYEKFGIPGMLEATRNSLMVLDKRFQWAKTQLLAALAVLAFILNLAVNLYRSYGRSSC
jgi:hypothetical protein